MKRLLVIGLILAVSFAGTAMAKETVLSFEVGALNPKAVESGVNFRLGSSWQLDERVEFGASLGLFRKSTTDEETVHYKDPVTGAEFDSVFTNFESSVTMIPVMANLMLKIPIEDAPIIPFLTGSIGYNFLWHSFDNYESKEGETNFYSGFGYTIGAGVIYPFGTNSALFGQVMYNGGSPSRSEDSAIGLPTRTEIDMSGIGFMIGLRFHGWKDY